MSRKYLGNTTINTRVYSWDLVIYEISNDYLLSKLNYWLSQGVVKHYAFIQHNLDVDLKDGVETPKPLHTHLLVVFNQVISVKCIKERLLEYTSHNVFGTPIRDVRGAFRYLLHLDNPEKHQYSFDDIYKNDEYFSKYDFKLDLSKSKDSDEINQMIDDYSSLSYRQMACKYGKDFIKNFKSYEYYFCLIYIEEHQYDIYKPTDDEMNSVVRSIKISRINKLNKHKEDLVDEIS